MKSLVTGALLWAFLAGIASAELVISAENRTLQFSEAPQTGSLEVYVQTDTSVGNLFGATTYVTLLPDSSGVSFTGVEKTSFHPYIFPTGGQGGPQPPTPTPNLVDVTDYDNGGFTLDNNEGLVKINFSVAAGTPAGTYNVQIDRSKTFLVNLSGGTVNYASFINGSITIEVPEPCWLALILSGSLSGWAFLRFRRGVQ